MKINVAIFKGFISQPKDERRQNQSSENKYYVFISYKKKFCGSHGKFSWEVQITCCGRNN
jgi:hypothetical protein